MITKINAELSPEMHLSYIITMQTSSKCSPKTQFD